MWGVIGRLLGLVVFVLGSISGFFVSIAPQSALQSQWTPGLAVATVSLAVLFIGGMLREILDRESVLASFGLVSAAVFFCSVPVYFATYHAMSIEVDHALTDGSGTYREVKGDTYTPAAVHERFVRGGEIPDEDLVLILGSVSAVWTDESVFDYWRRTLLFYILVASSLVCTVGFVGGFVDRATQDRIEARESATAAQRRARRRAARRRQTTSARF